jgi:hypothetical protein
MLRKNAKIAQKMHVPLGEIKGQGIAHGQPTRTAKSGAGVQGKTGTIIAR